MIRQILHRNAPLCRLREESLDGIMIDISQVRRLHLILPSFSEVQSVAQEMGVGTLGIVFQPGYASADNRSVEGLCRCLADALVRIAEKGRLFQAVCRSVVLPAPIVAVKLHHPSAVGSGILCQLPEPGGENPKACCLGPEGQMHAVGPHHLFLREEPHHLPHQRGLGRHLPVRRRGMPGEVQPLRGLRHGQIEIKPLQKPVLPEGGRQLHILLSKAPALLVRQNAAAPGGLRHHAVIEPGKEQHLDAIQSGPGNIADDHPVKHGGNQADLDLPEARIENIRVGGAGDLLFAQKGLRPIQKVRDETIDLIVLRGQNRIAGLPEFLRPLEEFILQAQLLQKGQKGLRPLPDCGPPLSGDLLQGGKGLYHLFPDPVQPVQIDEVRAGPGSLPGLIPAPVSPDAEGHHIVFQEIESLRIRQDKAGFQIPEHSLVGKILLHNIQRRPHQVRGRIFQNALLGIDEIGDLPRLKLVGKLPPVYAEIPGDHGDIPVPEAAGFHQTVDLRRNHRHLLGGGCGADKGDPVSVFRGSRIGSVCISPVTEQLFFRKLQLRAVLKPVIGPPA